MSIPTSIPSDRPKPSTRIAPSVPHTVMACTGCGHHWYVIELPEPFTDPATFVAPCCARFKEDA